MCPGARRWHAGPADGALWSNTAMCESEYDAATRTIRSGPTPRTDPRRGRLRSRVSQRSAVPRLRPGRVRHHGHCNLFAVDARPRASPGRPPRRRRAEPAVVANAAGTRSAEAAVFVVFVFLSSAASSCARSTAATGAPARRRLRARPRASHSASAPSLPHDANVAPPPGAPPPLTVRGGSGTRRARRRFHVEEPSGPVADAVTGLEPRHHRVSNTALSCARSLRLTSNEGNARARNAEPLRHGHVDDVTAPPRGTARRRFGVAPSSRRQSEPRTARAAGRRRLGAYPRTPRRSPAPARVARPRPRPGAEKVAGAALEKRVFVVGVAELGAPDTKSRTPGRSVLLAVRTSSRRAGTRSDAAVQRPRRVARACAEVVATCSR